MDPSTNYTSWGSAPLSENTQKAEYKLWDYNPSIPAATVAAGVCGFLTLIHAIRLTRNRTWFCIPLIIGGVFETAGYAARAGAHDNTKALPPYIAQSLLILLAPIFFAASIYSILGRIIHRVDGDEISIVHPSIMTRFFVWGDVLCFLVQAGGSGMLAQAKKQSDMKMGNTVILVGLGLQIYIFCFFVKIGVSFHRDLQKTPTTAAMDGEFPWERYMVLLYVACACVGIRNTYRVVEYAMGKVSSYFVTAQLI
ncbi:uncharacterized protein LTHEOB_4214 [Lasiodiplodia theobromae]|uniref:uncharacterized protein n=1 Tax=Lasiodiplodia theobromae TaxID=45133 RepID=UPI0015C306CA|nr:uncharacterized protein LTHEOB_4214 [Lasiodiplodia theobromae]KAF4546217.1 hypothetical protein LTHEOB_4214 [Lasiodiplodia theobromae]